MRYTVIASVSIAALFSGSSTVFGHHAIAVSSQACVLLANGGGAGLSGPPRQAPPYSVTVIPGGLQAAVNAHGANTSFMLRPGIYTDQTVTARTGDAFYGEGQVTWNGEGRQKVAIDAGNTNRVVVSGIVFTEFMPVINGNGIFGRINERGSNNFTLEGSVISNSVGAGTPVAVGRGSIISNNCIHDNYGTGVGGLWASDAVVSHNEIFNNNAGHDTPDTLAGFGAGIKLVSTTNVALKYNYVHNNFGVGVWFDTNNNGVVIDRNYISYNNYRGVMIEVSYGSIVSNNNIVGNGYASSWIAGDAIFISTASNVDAYDNVISKNANGIVVYEDPTRGSGSHGAWATTNVKIHDNYITLEAATTDVADSMRGFMSITGGAQSDATNRFTDNHYCLSPGVTFQVGGHNTNEEGWRAAGYDKKGTFDCRF